MNHFGKYCKIKYNLNTLISNISSKLFIGAIDNCIDCNFRSVVTVSFYESNKQDTGSDVYAIPGYIFKILGLSCKLVPF